ncbi:MAG: DedA family protein [Syntrophales bacterium LBB04]|nr:DedA family protein [Syntrophales bacterium LBB04]
MHALILFIIQYSYWGIFLALALGIFGLPIPDETLMAYIGFLSFQGKLAYIPVLAVAFLGTACGITMEYFLGKKIGYRLLKRYSSRMHVNSEHVQNAEKFFNTYGMISLFIGYFIPGIRHLTGIFAGTSRMPYRVFAIYAYAGGLVWTMTFVNMGYFLAEKWQRISGYSHRFIIPFLFVLIIFFALRIYLRMPAGNKESGS